MSKVLSVGSQRPPDFSPFQIHFHPHKNASEAAVISGSETVLQLHADETFSIHHLTPVWLLGSRYNSLWATGLKALTN